MNADHPTSWWGTEEIGFRVADHDGTLRGVRLQQRAGLTGPLAFSHDPAAGLWELRVPRPAVQRLEYRLELSRSDGRTEVVCDPGNPRRVSGGYGESSELRCPGYREPDWLRLPAAPGTRREVPLPLVSGETLARVWSPETATDRMLLAHDGPDYERHGGLLRYTEAMIGAGLLPPYHLVLVPAGDRDERYSADPDHARSLIVDGLPVLRAALGAAGPPVALGASLGALAVLHAQWRHPGAFAGMFLQSGSFFQPRHDAQESGFRHYPRIVTFVAEVLRAGVRNDAAASDAAVPTVLTCGTVEENLANNRDMALALCLNGYPCTLIEVPDAHTWTGWRDALDPSLTGLLRRVWPLS